MPVRYTKPMRDIRPKVPTHDDAHLFEPPPSHGAVPPARRRSAERGGTAVPVHAMRVSSLPTTGPSGTTASAKPASRPRMRIGHRERLIVSALLALVIVAGLLAVLLFLPKAEIALALRTAPLLVDEKLVVSAQPVSDNVTIPGSAFFREVDVTGSSPVTSTEVVGEKAQGTVVIVNRTVEEQKIKVQSRLITEDNTLFYMQTDATVPAASSAPGRVTVPVLAAEAGEKGNIEAQELNFAALDEASQSLVYAEATAPLTGGSGDSVPAVAEADLTAARKAAQQTAQAQVEQQVRAELPQNWAILEESWTVELPSFESTAEIGAREETIPYSARAVVRVMGFEQASLEAHLREALERRLEQDYMLFPGPISFSKHVEDVTWEEGRATIAVRVTHTTIPRFSLESLRSKIAGYPENEAKQYLEGLPGVQSVALRLTPFWASSIPRLERRIIIEPQAEREP